MELFFGPFDQKAYDLFATSFDVFVKGLFGFPINLPGTALHNAIKVVPLPSSR